MPRVIGGPAAAQYGARCTRLSTLPSALRRGPVSKGHPVGAIGLSMVHALALQLRGKAGQRQARRARIGLAENGGGEIGFDEPACAVTVLARVWLVWRAAQATRELDLTDPP